MLQLVISIHRGYPNGLASAREVPILTTPTIVIAYTPPVALNMLISIYFRVQTAPTNVTLTVTWYDITGLQTLVLIPNLSEVVGSYSMVSFAIDSIAGSPVTITMAAGTISQVLGSANISIP